MTIHFKEEQIWTRQSGSGKSKRTYIVKAVTACDEIDTIITMVDVESNNPVAAHAHIMNTTRMLLWWKRWSLKGRLILKAGKYQPFLSEKENQKPNW